MSKELTEFDSDPYSLFIFAINSPSTKEKCVPRLNKFFDYISLDGTIKEKCSTFTDKAKAEPSWAMSSVIKYLQMNKNRVEKKEITAATLLNSVKVLKIFDEMMSYSRLYNAAGVMACKPVLIQPILMSIIFENHKQLKKMESEIKNKQIGPDKP